LKVKVLFLLFLVVIYSLLSISSSSCAKRQRFGAVISKKDVAVDSEKFNVKVSGSPKEALDARGAVAAAIDHVSISNAGSSFKALDVCAVGNWARVSLHQIGVPREEAVAFDVFLRKNADGHWEVVECGNSLTPDDLPGAPEEVFKK